MLCVFLQGLSVQGADKGDSHKFEFKFNIPKTMCFDSDVGDGATNQDDVGRSAVMSSADSTASSANLSSTATTEQFHLRAE